MIILNNCNPKIYIVIFIKKTFKVTECIVLGNIFLISFIVTCNFYTLSHLELLSTLFFCIGVFCYFFCCILTQYIYFQVDKLNFSLNYLYLSSSFISDRSLSNQTIGFCFLYNHTLPLFRVFVFRQILFFDSI